MKKLEEINRLVEEAMGAITKAMYSSVTPMDNNVLRPILTTLARKCAEINEEDYHDCYNTPGNTVNNYNSRLREGQVEEVKQEEKLALQPLPEKAPEWFMHTSSKGMRTSIWNQLRYHFGTPPREWWQNLKKGDKFVFINEKDQIELDSLMLRSKDGVYFFVEDCSPYTDPAQSFRDKLTPEMQVEFDKLMEGK